MRCSPPPVHFPRAMKSPSVGADALVDGSRRKATGSTSQDRLESSALVPQTRVFHPGASIVLIGVRAAGKRSLGFIAASQLGRRFVTEGLHFEEVTGMSKGEYLQKHGTAAFLNQSMTVFRQLLERHKQDCVIECGISSLTRDARVLLRGFSETHPVIHIMRNFDHIRLLSGLKDHDVARLKDADLSHRTCSNLEFYNLYDPTCRAGTGDADGSSTSSFILSDVKMDFQTFIRLTTGRLSLDHRHPVSISSVPLEKRSYTYATVLRMSDLLCANIDLDQLESGEDAIELKVDVQVTDLTVISKQISKLRRKNPLPIIYNVDRGSIDSSVDVDAMYFRLLDHGLRLGVEYLVVDIRSPYSYLVQLLANKGYTRVIGHNHFESASPAGWLDRSRVAAYHQAKDLGFDIIRFEQIASCRQDNTDVKLFVDRISSCEGDPYLIAYNLGNLGRMSLVFNRILTPVKLPGYPVHRHEGRREFDSTITTREATQALFRCFEFDSLQYFVVTSDFFLSGAPAMHNAAFQLLGMEHEFSSLRVTAFQDAVPSMQKTNFGGASVSFPYKIDAFTFTHFHSKHAAAIGAVNTILPLRPGPDGKTPPLEQQFDQRNRAGPVSSLYGDNTDWIGFLRCLRHKMSPRNAVSYKNGSGIVLGAGGSARSAIYAMIQLGCQNIFVYNRTEENAARVASHFNAWASRERPSCPHPVRLLPRGQVDWPADVDPPTLILSCIPASAQADLYLPTTWLASLSGGVAGDV